MNVDRPGGQVGNGEGNQKGESTGKLETTSAWKQQNPNKNKKSLTGILSGHIFVVAVYTNLVVLLY